LAYLGCGVEETEEQSWLTNAVSMVFFSVAGFVTLYALQRLSAAVQPAGAFPQDAIGAPQRSSMAPVADVGPEEFEEAHALAGGSDECRQRWHRRSAR
jgi:hypothetical protein